MAEHTTYIVILNWNGYQDTINCLQSCLGLTDTVYKIIVCDNGSTDGSLAYLQRWLNDDYQAPLPEHDALKQLVTQPTIKPKALWLKLSEQHEWPQQPDHDLIIIDNEANLGFAAGNNTGISFAMSQADMTHVWLLNNDTLVCPDTLSKQLQREQQCAPCVVGSLIKFFDDPSVIQAVGGNRYNRYTGIASQSLGRYLPDTSDLDIAHYEAQLDYICGASMLLSRQFLAEIGLMEERYFLYYEEIDWSVRSKNKYPLRVAKDAVVYHKEGSSIGSASFDSAPSAFSEFCKTRAKLWFTAKFYPHAYISCYLFTLAQALNRLRQGYKDNAITILKVLMGQREFIKND